MSFVKDKMKDWAATNPVETRAGTRARGEGGGRRMREKLSHLFTDADLARAAEVLRETLEAKGVVVVPGSKGCPSTTVEFIDHKARLEAVKFLAAYTEGLPVARQLSIQADFQSLDDERKAMMLNSPAVLEALAELGSMNTDLQALTNEKVAETDSCTSKGQ